MKFNLLQIIILLTFIYCKSSNTISVHTTTTNPLLGSKLSALNGIFISKKNVISQGSGFKLFKGNEIRKNDFLSYNAVDLDATIGQQWAFKTLVDDISKFWELRFDASTTLLGFTHDTPALHGIYLQSNTQRLVLSEGWGTINDVAVATDITGQSFVILKHSIHGPCLHDFYFNIYNIELKQSMKLFHDSLEADGCLDYRSISHYLFQGNRIIKDATTYELVRGKTEEEKLNPKLGAVMDVRRSIIELIAY